MSEEKSVETPTQSESPAETDWLMPETLAVQPGEPAPAPKPEPEPAAVEGDDDPLTDDEPIATEDDDDEDGPPEFWSAERKAEWQKLKDFPELRAAIKAHHDEANRGLNKKLEEAAAARKVAEETAQKIRQSEEQYVNWWNQNAEKFAQTFVDRWKGVNWTQLAAENPAEWARLNQMRTDEHAQLEGAARQAQEANQRVSEQRKGEEQQARVAEHEKLATKYPKAFGKPEIAKKTYDTLAQFAMSKGIPANRLNQTYEAPIVEILMEAYKYNQLRTKAKEVTNPQPIAQPASKTPTRIVPGATQRAANQPDEATRQAEERLRSGNRLLPHEAALVFR